MKKLALIFVMVLLASLPTFAQKKEKTPAQRAEKKMVLLTEQLDLTQTQITKLKPALLTKFTKVKEARKNDDEEAIITARKAYREILRATLTDDQLKRYRRSRRKTKPKKDIK